MPRTYVNKFNRGEIDPRFMTRDDIEQVNNTCELMENWLPRRGGWMQYRPGTAFVGACKTNVSHVIIPFVDDGETPTLLEFSSSSANPSVETVRIWVEAVLLEVVSTADSIVNGEFTTDISGWSTDHTGAGTAAWSSNFSGSARIVGGTSGGDSGCLHQTVSTTAGERTIELYIDEAQMLVQIGTNGARSNDIFEGLLSPGYHMLTFTADGSNVTYSVTNRNPYYGYLRYLSYKASGEFELQAPFFTSTDTEGSVLETVRYAQVNDVLYLTSSGYYSEGFAWPLINIRRWSNKSWSFELPQVVDGPFGPLNDTQIELYPSVQTGNGNLTASYDFFTDPGHIGRLYKIVHGSTEGICRILEITSTTVATMQVIKRFGGSGPGAATRDWYEGRFAYYLPSPTCVELYQNRLWLAGGAQVYASVSDLYQSFDETVPGDSAAIQKTIARGPVQDISWMAGIDELLLGLSSEEMRVTSNSDYDPVTSSNITLRRGTTRGAADTQPVIVEGILYFVQRGLKKLLSLTGLRGGDMGTTDTTLPHPTVTGDGIKRIAYTAEPEPRMYVLLTDGSLRCLLFDDIENVQAWSRITIGGGATVVDIATIPSTGEDQVYLIVERAGVRTMEKFTDEANAVGQSDSRHYDSHIVETSPGGTVTGLDHLEGLVVDIWADGQPRGRATVTSGQIGLDETVWTDVVVGVKHTAKWRSNRLARYIDENVFNYRKRIKQMGLIAKSFAIRTFKYGTSEDSLSYLPDIENGRPRPPSVDPYPTIIDKLLGTLEGPMKTSDVALYKNYIVTAADSVPTPPEANRYQRFAFYEANESLYLAGGDNAAAPTPLADAYRYDPATESLFELADMHKAVSEQTVAIDNVNGLLFVWGAASGGSDNFQMYEIATDTWFGGTTGVTVDQPTRGNAPHAHMVEYDEKVYLHGGNSSGFSVVDWAIYDIATDTWDNAPTISFGTPIATREGAYCAPRLGLGAGRLYFWGGYEGSLTDSNLFQVYDVSGATWATLSSSGCGNGRQQAMMAAPGDDFLYLWGGKPRTGTGNFDFYVYQYDVQTGTWSFILTSEGPAFDTPYSRKGFGMFADTINQDKFYIGPGIGNNVSTSARNGDIWYYDVLTDEWVEVASVLSPAAGAIRIYDATDPDALATESALNLSSGSDDIRGFAVLVDDARDVAFILGIEDDDATLNKCLVSVDISDPANPEQLDVIVGGTDVSTNNKGLAFDGRYLFVPSLSNLGTIDVIDTADTSALTKVGDVTPTYDTNAASPQRMVYDSGYLYVAWEDDWHVINAGDAANPVVVSEEPTETNLTGISGFNNTMIQNDGDYFVLAGNSHGRVHIFRRISPINFEYLGSNVADAEMVGMVDIQVFWPYIYAATPTYTHVIDATNPLGPTVIAEYQGYTDVTSMRGPSPGLFFSGSITSSGQLYASDVRSWELVDYDEMSFEFNDVIDTDRRLYFECDGPATILAVTFSVEDIDYPTRDTDGPGQP